MKTSETNLANVEFPTITPMPNEEGIARVSSWNPSNEQPPIRSRRWHLAGFLAAGYFASSVLTLAHGNSGMGGHGNASHGDHWHYPYSFSGPSYGYHAGLYDSVYSYTPTPEQRTAAQQQVDSYLLGVKKHRKHVASHRYISVETLRPTKKQVDDYVRKQPPTHHVEPAQLRCLMVFDTRTREFVGTSCYVVSTPPLVGEVSQFEAVSAEFVGHGKL